MTAFVVIGAGVAGATAAAKPEGTSPSSSIASAGPVTSSRESIMGQTMRKVSTSVQRRHRENERGVVSPSPVGEAMVNEV